MRQTWRWFGPRDQVSIDDLCQAGVEGVVSALHEVPSGEPWTLSAIDQRRAEIARLSDGSPSGLEWEVVESLPVSESIKKQTGDWRNHLDHYRSSLRHLAARNIRTICYNFMPVLDWTRTDLAWKLPHGGTCMRFDAVDFALFDCFLLERAGALNEHDEVVVESARERESQLDAAARRVLIDNIVCGLPGAAEHMTLAEVRRHLDEYRFIDETRLRAHLADFLGEVIPTAETLGLRLCCHPDDPPWPLLGLPRIVSSESDYRQLLAAADSPSNGITLCTGSLGAQADNDLPGMMQRLGPHVHFLHLRNVRRETSVERGSFHEAAHLDGSTDMPAVIAAVLAEEQRRRATGREDWQIPMRPDHGQNLLDDLRRDAQPGYPAIGRLRGLAELRGVQAGLNYAAREQELPRA